MLESLKNNVRLLRRSKRHVILFELTYKLLAVAVIYPILTAAINLCMKVAGIRYLTNEYIVKALTNPVVIIALFTVCNSDSGIRIQLQFSNRQLPAGIHSSTAQQHTHSCQNLCCLCRQNNIILQSHPKVGDCRR